MREREKEMEKERERVSFATHRLSFMAIAKCVPKRPNGNDIAFGLTHVCTDNTAHCRWVFNDPGRGER